MDLYSDDDEEIIEYISSVLFITEKRKDHFNSIKDEDFHRIFRLQKSVVSTILEKIKHSLEYNHTNRNEALSPMNQLLCTLLFYATGSQMNTAEFIGIHESTACRLVHKVTEAIAQLEDEYVYMPMSQAELRNAREGFYQIAGFPRVVGAIGCTHVRIKSPGGGQAQMFRNRKGYYSINVQAICSARFQFRDLVTECHGSAQNCHIWDNCIQKSHFSQGTYGDSLLVGDSGYEQTSYIMTPSNQISNQNQSLYNESHYKTKNIIDQTFRLWKNRFPILTRGVYVQFNKIPGIITATCVLHNIAQMCNEPEAPLDPEFPPLMDEDDGVQFPGVADDLGSHARDVIVEQPFGQIQTNVTW